MESIEQQLIQMLKNLPTPIIMTWSSGLYQWRTTEHTGSAADFVIAMNQALHSILAINEHAQPTQLLSSRNGTSL